MAALPIFLKPRSTGESSQVSRITSTPRAMSPANLVSSPSVSTIEDPASGSVRYISFSSGSEIQDSDSVNPTDTRSICVPLKGVKWIKAKTAFQPTRKDSLFYQLTSKPGETERIALDVVINYKNNKSKGIMMVLQLFVDLTGYENVNLETIYCFDKPNLKKIIEVLQTDLDPEIQKKGTYLLEKFALFESIIERIVADFLGHLLTALYDSNILVDGIFATHIFEFLREMSISCFLPIKVTAVIIVLKFLTEFVNLYHRRYTNDGSNTSYSNNTKENEERKSQIEDTIDFLYTIYDSNCLQDGSVSLRVKCSKEMIIWIKLFPGVFVLKRKCLKRLERMIEDREECVRLAAMDISKQLLKDKKIMDEMQSRVAKCLEKISGRFNDCSYKVTVKAIDVFTVAVNLYSPYILDDYILSIVKKIYFANTGVSTASGKFLATFLKMKYQNDDIQLLINLSQIAHLREDFSIRVLHFLEACIEFLPQLTNWSLLLQVITDEEIDLQTRKYSLIILKGVINIVDSKKLKTNPERNYNVDIAPHLKTLILQFWSDPLSLINVFEIALFLNNTNVRQVGETCYLDILNRMKTVYEESQDENLVRSVIKVFKHMSDTQRDNPANGIVTTLIQECVKTTNTDLQKVNSQMEEPFKSELVATTMRLSIIFESFDLSKFVSWNLIFGVWNASNFEILKYVPVACKWWLVLTLRNYIKTSAAENGETVPDHILFNNCQAFIHKCIELLEDFGETSKSYMMFEIISDFYNSFEKELFKKRTFSKFFIRVTSKNHQEILAKFVTHHVIENKQTDLAKRQKYLNNFTEMVYLEVIPVEYFSRILRYYHSHNAEFGYIMDHILDCLQRVNPGLPLLVQHTLAEEYEQLLQKQQNFNIFSEEAKALKLLAKKLATFKHIKSPPSQLLKLVQIMILYAMKSEEYFPFLNFGRYFAELLSDDLKDDAYKIFRQKVPRGHRQNNILISFGKTLKTW